MNGYVTDAVVLDVHARLLDHANGPGWQRLLMLPDDLAALHDAITTHLEGTTR